MSGWKRQVATKVGNAFGLEILHKESAKYWPEEDFVRRLFAEIGPDCVFDVGANVGQFGQSLRAIGYEGILLSFEPAPKAFAGLQTAARGDTNWHVFNYALGASAETLEFNLMKWDVFSSFRAPRNETNLPFNDVNVIERVVDVPVWPLGDVFQELRAGHGFTRPFLKMDTQGFDLEVLRGAQPCLDQFVGLVSEVAVRALYEDSPTLVDSLAAFTALGFDLAGMFSVHPDVISTPLEFNCYAVRRGAPAE